MAKHQHNRRAESLMTVEDQRNIRTPNNTVQLDQYRKQSRPIQLIPKSLTQETYIDLLLDPEKYIVFATGPAGTGKTMLAVLAALKAYKEGEVEKIIITRPAVGTDDEQHGFLPGTLTEKMAPWCAPILDIMGEYYRQQDIARMLEEKKLELAPLAFQRGRSFKNSFVIFDESQNSSVNQMKMLLTRLGDGSKLVVTGDLEQTDRQFTKDNGLIDFTRRLSASSSNVFGYVEFHGKDIQRSIAVREVLKLYSEC